MSLRNDAHGGSWRRSALIFVLVLAVVAPVGSRWLTSANASLAPVSLPAPGTAYFGTYTPPAGAWTAANQRNAYLSLEADIGRRLDIAQLFYKWNGSFPGWWETWNLDSGRIPLIAWAGHDTNAINSGSQDAWIRARADALKALGRPVFLRWGSEMDGTVNASWSRSPSAFVAAWQRIVSIFRSQGATNVSWAWCPTANGFRIGTAQQYYPGDTYVDWICSDGYNWAPGRPGDPWRSFAEVFQNFYDWGTARGKPLLVAEYGVQERAPGEKAAWFAAARDTLATRFTNIRAVVYFDTLRDYDWRVRTSASSLSAFGAMGRDPHFLQGSSPSPSPTSSPSPSPTRPPKHR
jgi:hypothetical protein